MYICNHNDFASYIQAAFDANGVKEDEYRIMIKKLLDYDGLYFLASNDSIANNTASPRISQTSQNGIYLSVFTKPDYCKAFSDYFQLMNCHFVYITKEQEFWSVFATAKTFGVNRVLIDEGQRCAGIPLEHIFSYGGLSTSPTMALTKEQVDYMITNNVMPQLQFNRFPICNI